MEESWKDRGVLERFSADPRRFHGPGPPGWPVPT